MELNPKVNIYTDVFQALMGLVAVVKNGAKPYEVLHEAEFVIQEVLAGRMDYETVTPGDDSRHCTPDFER